MSKIANWYLLLSGIFRNHSITLLVSFHWLILRESLSWWIILPRMFLLIRPSWSGLISLTLGLFLKFGLDKNRYKFAIFDTKYFYPSISEKLLTNVLNFAKEREREDIVEKTCKLCTTPENHFCLVMKSLGWKEKETFLTSLWELTTVPKFANW